MLPVRVIVHCSASPDYDISSKKFDLIGAREINIWHKQRDFKRIGYHWVIRRTGVIEPGRPEDEVGAHCMGENHDSLGICYVGTEIPTTEQLESLKSLFIDVSKRHSIPLTSWFTHNHFNPHKSCPGFSLEHLRSILDNIDIV